MGVSVKLSYTATNQYKLSVSAIRQRKALTMFLGYWKNGEDYFGNIYFDFEEFYADTFSPDISPEIIMFKLHNGSYQEKKSELEELAKFTQYVTSSIDLSYGELAMICDFFRKYGKRYGLLEEFRENAIIGG